MTALAFAYSASPKRPVNLSLSEALVKEARQFTDNLSATMEGLMAQFVQSKQKEQLSRQQQVDQLCQAWNAVYEQHGSFADEHCNF